MQQQSDYDSNMAVPNERAARSPLKSYMKVGLVTAGANKMNIQVDGETALHVGYAADVDEDGLICYDLTLFRYVQQSY